MLILNGLRLQTNVQELVRYRHLEQFEIKN